MCTYTRSLFPLMSVRSGDAVKISIQPHPNPNPFPNNSNTKNDNPTPNITHDVNLNAIVSPAIESRTNINSINLNPVLSETSPASPLPSSPTRETKAFTNINAVPDNA